MSMSLLLPLKSIVEMVPEWPQLIIIIGFRKFGNRSIIPAEEVEQILYSDPQHGSV